MIYEFDYPGLPTDPPTEAFEVLAARWVTLNSRRPSVFYAAVPPADLLAHRARATSAPTWPNHTWSRTL